MGELMGDSVNGWMDGLMGCVDITTRGYVDRWLDK